MKRAITAEPDSTGQELLQVLSTRVIISTDNGSIKYNPEIHDAVMGPVDEFGQVGYDDAKAGGTFLKIGVGILTKPDDKAYNSFRLYPITNPGKWKIKKYGDGIQIYTKCEGSGVFIFIRKEHSAD